ncbi:hypothetical protein UT300018_05070 [Clostridium faecium]
MLGKKVISILLCSLVAFGSMTSVAYAKNDDSIKNHNVIKKQINNNQKIILLFQKRMKNL